jgi:hypothetical protein
LQDVYDARRRPHRRRPKLKTSRARKH